MGMKKHERGCKVQNGDPAFSHVYLAKPTYVFSPDLATKKARKTLRNMRTMP